MNFTSSIPYMLQSLNLVWYLPRPTLWLHGRVSLGGTRVRMYNIPAFLLALVTLILFYPTNFKFGMVFTQNNTFDVMVEFLLSGARAECKPVILNTFAFPRGFLVTKKLSLQRNSSKRRHLKKKKEKKRVFLKLGDQILSFKGCLLLRRETKLKMTEFLLLSASINIKIYRPWLTHLTSIVQVV